MQLNITLEEAHWMRYAILTTAAEESRDSSQRKLFTQLLEKLDDAEAAAAAAENDAYYADDGSRFPAMNQDDPNRPGVGDQW